MVKGKYNRDGLIETNTPVPYGSPYPFWRTILSFENK